MRPRPIDLLLLVAASCLAIAMLITAITAPKHTPPPPTVRTVTNEHGQVIAYLSAVRDFDGWLASHRSLKIVSIAFPHQGYGGVYVVYEERAEK
jgi:hypothetical protein